ncbi:aryl-alcohol oxidase [Mycena maculata]|uniref:Aryl-alcohol oxidase n=1 Tax=Mycena maculata TaxID=230809 RepID=A0AAD7IVY7_9AGAR|nr:aryl-alcohol oxidase [Mycena maculata]
MFLHLDADSPIFDNFTDPAAGPNTPHIEIGFGAGSPIVSASTSNFVGSGLLAVTSTMSRSIRRQTTDLLDHPVIDLGLLTSEFDIFAAREALRRALRFFATPTWDGYLLVPTVDLANMTTAELDQYICNTTLGSYHLAGTAAMTAGDAGWGVVNSDLRIKNVTGVHIIDAFVSPILPSAHTQAPTTISCPVTLLVGNPCPQKYYVFA